MRILNRGLRWLVPVAMVFGCALAPSLQAETTDEQLQRLQTEIDELRQMLEQQKTPGAVPHASPVGPSLSVPEVAEKTPLRSGVFIRYYISADRLGEEPPAAVAPTVEGRFSGTDTLSFDPAAYDVPGSGQFSNYRDPSSYRYIGLLLAGELAVSSAGKYEFIVSPKPAREGGANVATRMSVWLEVDDQVVVEFSDQTSWRSQRGQVHLEPGQHLLRMWAVAASDGFGPSPTDSRLLLALKEPGDASPMPLRDLRPVRD